MSFCTKCGSKFADGAAFCTNCGAKLADVPKAGPSEVKTNLASGSGRKSSDEHDWDSFFAPGSDSLKISRLSRTYIREKKHCIVLTNLQKFRDALGDKYLDFEIALRTYCMGRIADGWRFHLLDLSSNRLGSLQGDSWEECAEQLRNGVERLQREGRAKVDAVFIVGDEGIIPMALFDNPLYDEFFGSNPDQDVDSDLPYSTLSDKDPFTDSVALDIKVTVGRLPTGLLDGGQIAANYFQQANDFKTFSSSSSRGFGVTAEVWQGASQEVASMVGDINLFNSPDVTIAEFPTVFDEQSNYYYFNVHGSDMDKHWFGEGAMEGCMPVVSPEHFKKPSLPNVLATEACYGARFIGHSQDESCLRNALLGKTLAFSGSSRIAYGPAFAPVGLADIIALEFLSATKRGDCFGDAFCLARLAVLETDEPTPHDLLTYVEFNLFGDPTLTLPAAQSASSAEGNSYAKSSTGGVGKSALSPRNPLSSVRASLQHSTNNMHIRIPDVLEDVKQSLDSTWQSIRDRMLEEIYRTQPELLGTEPQVKLMRLGVSRKETMQVSVLKKQNNIFIGRTIYTDRSGKIISQISPK
jgi:hypothetical protein